MSGSPILDRRGQVVGIISIGGDRDPIPLTNLPVWLLADLRPSLLAKLPRQMAAQQMAWVARNRREFRKIKARNARIFKTLSTSTIADGRQDR